MEKIRSFTGLTAWREGHKLVLLIYKITGAFPREEMFGLTSQMRRCAVSVTSNVAEGFSRQTYKEKVQFYSMAIGSLMELQNQLVIARDIGYLRTKNDFDDIAKQTILVGKLIHGLKRTSLNKPKYTKY